MDSDFKFIKSYPYESNYKAIIRSVYVDINNRHRIDAIYHVGNGFQSYLGGETSTKDSYCEYLYSLINTQEDRKENNDAILGVRFDLRLSGADYNALSQVDRVALCSKTVNAFTGILRCNGLTYDMAMIYTYNNSAKIHIFAHDDSFSRTAQQYADIYNKTCMSAYFDLFGAEPDTCSGRG